MATWAEPVDRVASCVETWGARAGRVGSHPVEPPDRRTGLET